VTDAALAAFDRDVRLHIFREAASTGEVPQPPAIARTLDCAESDVRAAVRRLAAGRVLIAAPNSDNIWAANPFCAVPSGYRVETAERRYWGICAWDALGIAAALGSDAVVSAPCGDCGAPMALEVRDGRLARGEGVVHFAVPARRWWENIGFT
jgi:hypothetical protein